MRLINLIKKILFYFKYRKNINDLIKTFHADNIRIGKGTIIKNFSSFQAHKNNSKGKITIGENNNIGESLKILAGTGTVTIGDNIVAGSKFTLLGGGDIYIGNNVLISHNVVISSSSHNLTNPRIVATKTESTFNPVLISDNVFIGANSTILMGTTIKEGAIIGAGSVITENTTIGENEIWYGNPAKLQKSRTSLKIQLEAKMVHYLETYPFHNLFRLYLKQDMSAPKFGGTCSDRTLHFKENLENFCSQNSIDIKLHIASINGKRTHTILRILIEEKIYFCDIGMGYPITKLIPSNQNIHFKSYDIEFRTIIKENEIVVFINEHKGEGEKELMSIDTREQLQEKVKNRIKNRLEDTKDVPLAKRLRYFFIYDGEFYQIKE